MRSKFARCRLNQSTYAMDCAKGAIDAGCVCFAAENFASIAEVPSASLPLNKLEAGLKPNFFHPGSGHD